MDILLTNDEKIILLRLARQALEYAVQGRTIKPLDLKLFPPKLGEVGSSFVTLTKKGELRGCIGSLEPYLPLIDDVREHAVAAALQDYRFPPVESDELIMIRIEISRLTLPQPLVYDNSEDLLKKLRPGIDGVILKDRHHRATFLPQVWEKIPEPADFLDHLCHKMGAPPDLWRYKKLVVEIYQVEEFHE